MSKSEYSDVIVLGAGLAGHVCAAALPGSTLVGKPGSLPVYNVELYDPLATFLGFEPDHEVKGRVWIHRAHEESTVRGPWAGYWESYPAPLQSAPGYRLGGLFRLHRSVPDAPYTDANEHVWGAKIAEHLNAYNDKKLGVGGIDARPLHDTWRPPDRKKRLRTLLNSESVKRASVPVADFLAAAITKARREGVSFVQHNAAQVEVSADEKRGPIRVWVPTEAAGAEMAELFECKMLINTVPFPVFAQIREGGCDRLDFARQHLNRSGLLVVEVTGGQAACDYDTFLSPELHTQRVTHDGSKHIVEIPRRYDLVRDEDVKAVERVVCMQEVEELGRLGIFGEAYSMGSPTYVPNGYPFIFQEQAEEWKGIKQQDRELGIHHVGRWAAWDQSYTSHVYTKIEELKRRWHEHE